MLNDYIAGRGCLDTLIGVVEVSGAAMGAARGREDALVARHRAAARTDGELETVLDDAHRSAGQLKGRLDAIGRALDEGVSRSATTTSTNVGKRAFSQFLLDKHRQILQLLDEAKESSSGLTTRMAAINGYQPLSGGPKDAPATPLKSGTWKQGDKRHQPYVAGPGGEGPPNYPDAPPWVDIYDRTQDPDKAPHYFVRSDEIPGYQTRPPGAYGPPTLSDQHGNPDPYIELSPNSGIWVPKSDFPGAKFYPPGSQELPPYGWDEYVPGSGIFLWHNDTIPEPYHPHPSSLPPATYPQGH